MKVADYISKSKLSPDRLMVDNLSNCSLVPPGRCFRFPFENHYHLGMLGNYFHLRIVLIWLAWHGVVFERHGRGGGVWRGGENL